MGSNRTIARSPSANTSRVYYPAFLDLCKKKVVVVGGGKVAERKIGSLLKTGATITVVSPRITKKIERQRQKERVRHISRSYRKGDLKGAFLVVAATDSLTVNQRVSQDAPCLVNVVDTPHLCNFIVPSTFTRGPLQIAISTGGISPALARSIRKELEAKYGAEFARYVRMLRKVRCDAMGTIRDRRKRAAFLKCVASPEMMRKVAEKGVREVRPFVKELFGKAKKSAE